MEAVQNGAKQFAWESQAMGYPVEGPSTLVEA